MASTSTWPDTDPPPHAQAQAQQTPSPHTHTRTLHPNLPFNRFVVLRTCGHVLSSAAMKEIPSSQCLTCNKPFDKLDVIVLCPDDKTAVQMKDNMIARRKAKVKAIPQVEDIKWVESSLTCVL